MNIFSSFNSSKKIYYPSPGAVVYTELGFGLMEHSGIYIDGGRLIELNGLGQIREVDLHEFTGHITTFNHELWVPVNQYDMTVNQGAVTRAFEMVGKERNYNLVLDNCHQFVAGCMTGDFDNSCNFLWMLKEEVNKLHGEEIRWKKWDWKKNPPPWWADKPYTAHRLNQI